MTSWSWKPCLRRLDGDPACSAYFREAHICGRDDEHPDACECACGARWESD